MIVNMNDWNSPVRHVIALVELYEGSTLVATYSSRNRIKNLQIQRVGNEKKFFGFGVCQRLNLRLIDTNRELNITTDHTLKVYFYVQYKLSPCPTFKVSEVRRDENTNELSITAYDLLYEASHHYFNEVNITTPYTMENVADKCAEVAGAENYVVIKGFDESYNPLTTVQYDSPANLEGTETLREVFDDIAEATQSIYYVDQFDRITFKKPDMDGNPVLTINKSDYFTLDSKTNRRLSDICSTTSLGDNVITESGSIGTTQYVRDNAFWALREDIVDLLNNAIGAVCGFTINQFDVKWRGNPAVEIGDKIAIVTKNDETVYAYVYDDTIEYNGQLLQTTKWSYSEAEESAANPVSLGDALKMTYAKVDKVNKQVEIMAKDMEEATQISAEWKLTTNQITAQVQSLGNVAETNSKLIKNFSSKLDQTAQNLRYEIKQEVYDSVAGGSSKVVTSTGFTFDEEGLTISKSNSEMSTQITEDGLTVYRNNDEMLIADNEGIYAANLNATTFFIMGDCSRFEDYKNRTRTACFWIGGV